MKLSMEKIKEVDQAMNQFRTTIQQLPLCLDRVHTENLWDSFLILHEAAKSFVYYHEEQGIRQRALNEAELKVDIAVNQIWQVGLSPISAKHAYRKIDVYYKIVGVFVMVYLDFKLGLESLQSYN